MIYLYNYAGEPWKAQYWLRQVMDRMYTPTPDGYCGDEDNGQTSAWYVFSALGFYPVCPGTTQYVLGAPLFKRATLHFENGKQLTINAPANNADNFYIESMKFNGKNYTKNYLEHFEMLEGGTLDIEMGSQPNKPSLKQVSSRNGLFRSIMYVLQQFCFFRQHRTEAVQYCFQFNMHEGFCQGGIALAFCRRLCYNKHVQNVQKGWFTIEQTGTGKPCKKPGESLQLLGDRSCIDGHVLHHVQCHGSQADPGSGHHLV